MQFELRFRYGVVAVVTLLFLFSNSAWSKPGPLLIQFLDIGQGDSILIRTPHNRKILLDGGPGTSILERLGEELNFWEKHIDLMILSHPDLDHLEGLVEVLQRFEVHRVLMTGAVHGSQLYRAFLVLLKEQGVQIFIASPDQDWLIDDGVFLDILGPEHSVALQKVENANDASIIIKLVYRESSLLLTGDAEKSQEQELLLSPYNLSAEVFKAGHHGSRTSNTEDFLRVVNPDLSIVSSGLENSFGHPHLGPLLSFDEKGIEWIDTKSEGTITLSSDGNEWVVN